MAPVRKLTLFLKKNKAVCEAVEHKKVFTAYDKAQTKHCAPQDIAKTLVVLVDRTPALVVLGANRTLDIAKLKKIENARRKKWNAVHKRKAEKKRQVPQGAKQKRIRSESTPMKMVKTVVLANERWMKKHLDGDVGATPPFGSLWGVHTYIDSALLRRKQILIPTGDYVVSLNMTPKELLRLNGEELTKGDIGALKH